MDKDLPVEKLYKAGWHFAIAGIGLLELRRGQSKASKVLSLGLIAFHIDGAIADLAGTKMLSRRIVEHLTGKE